MSNTSSTIVTVSDLARGILALESERATLMRRISRSMQEQEQIMQQAMASISSMRDADRVRYERLLALEEAVNALLTPVL